MRFAVFCIVLATIEKETSCSLFGINRFFERRPKTEHKKIWTCKPLLGSRVTYANEDFGSVLFAGIETCVTLPDDVKLNELFDYELLEDADYQQSKVHCYFNEVHETTISAISPKTVKERGCRTAREFRDKLLAAILPGQNQLQSII